MKVPISPHAVISLDAPVLPAYTVVLNGTTRWHVWCKHCGEWHTHGAAEGRGITVRSHSIFGTIGGSLQTIFGGNISLFTGCARKHGA
jgi:hypothetical protein